MNRARYLELSTDTYLADMQSVEQCFPNVQFIYATGKAIEQHCQDASASSSTTRSQVRRGSKKVLVDFGDLDAWYNGKQTMYAIPSWCGQYGCPPGENIPAASPNWAGATITIPASYTHPRCDKSPRRSGG